VRGDPHPGSHFLVSGVSAGVVECECSNHSSTRHLMGTHSRVEILSTTIRALINVNASVLKQQGKDRSDWKIEHLL
jgi:hypothetical protein